MVAKDAPTDKQITKVCDKVLQFYRAGVQGALAKPDEPARPVPIAAQSDSHGFSFSLTDELRNTTAGGEPEPIVAAPSTPVRQRPDPSASGSKRAKSKPRSKSPVKQSKPVKQQINAIQRAIRDFESADVPAVVHKGERKPSPPKTFAKPVVKSKPVVQDEEMVQAPQPESPKADQPMEESKQPRSKSVGKRNKPKREKSAFDSRSSSSESSSDMQDDEGNDVTVANPEPIPESDKVDDDENVDQNMDENNDDEGGEPSNPDVKLSSFKSSQSAADEDKDDGEDGESSLGRDENYDNPEADPSDGGSDAGDIENPDLRADEQLRLDEIPSSDNEFVEQEDQEESKDPRPQQPDVSDSDPVRGQGRRRGRGRAANLDAQSGRREFPSSLGKRTSSQYQGESAAVDSSVQQRTKQDEATGQMQERNKTGQTRTIALIDTTSPGGGRSKAKKPAAPHLAKRREKAQNNALWKDLME